MGEEAIKISDDRLDQLRVRSHRPKLFDGDPKMSRNHGANFGLVPWLHVRLRNLRLFTNFRQRRQVYC